MPRKNSTEPPAKVETPEERGQMLRHLIAQTQKGMGAFTKEAGIPRSTLNALLNGQNDILLAQPKTAAAIMDALGMEDALVADMLHLTDAARLIWRGSYSQNEGARSSPRKILHYRLTRPLMGEVVLPADTVITVDTANTDHGIQVIELCSGEFYTMRSGPAAHAAGALKGQLVSADFSGVIFAPGQ